MINRPWVSVVMLLALFVMVVTSGLLFIILNNHPVFDDPNSIRDIARYAESGVTLQTIREHINPAGPFSYAFIGLLGEVLGGELWSFRLVVLISATATIAFLLSGHAEGWRSLAPVLFILVNPYTWLASSTLLTEFPALLVFVTGLYLWTAGLCQRESLAGGWSLAVGGLLIGLAIIGRQYYIAALPAMAGVFLLDWWRVKWRIAPGAFIAVLTSGLLAALPIMFLFVLWGGLTSPSIQNGVSYAQHEVGLGLDLLRPVTAALYIGIAVLPVLIFQPLSWGWRARFIAAAAMIGLLVGLNVSGTELWCATGSGCGPVSQIYWALSGQSTSFGMIASIVFASAGILGILLFVKFAVDALGRVEQTLLQSFGLIFLSFFVIEQLFVGGSVPFYERYVLQIAPLFGLVLAPNANLSINRALLGSAPLIALGIVRLWKYY